MKPILISGKLRSGKDLFASVFVEQYGYERMSLADSLKYILMTAENKKQAVDILLSYCEQVFGKINNDLKRRCDVIIDNTMPRWKKFKKEELFDKKTDESRKAMQHLGTEGVRKILRDDFWIRLFINKAKGKKVVVPDVRFKNELTILRKELNAIAVRIERPANMRDLTGDIIHDSEIDLDDVPAKKTINTNCQVVKNNVKNNIMFDYRIENNTNSIDVYKKQINTFIQDVNLIPTLTM